MQQKSSNNEQLILLALSKVIKNKRQECNKSQRLLADEYEIHKSMISRIENCTSEPKIFSLWEISYALGIKTSELLKLVEEELQKDVILCDT